MELDEKVQAGHLENFPLEAVTSLQNLWLLPVAVISQVGRRLHLIFDFTLSGLNDIAERLSPMDVMHFGGALLCILKQVLTTDPRLGPVYLSKVHLSYAYMRMWARIQDVPSFAFLIPKKTPRDTQLVGFHLSFTIGYIDSVLYFCMETETVADLANKAISQRVQVSKHQLELAAKSRATNNSRAHETKVDAIWEHLPEEQRTAAKSNIHVYLDDLISVIQRGPRERRKMLRHLFHQIDRVLRPN